MPVLACGPFLIVLLLASCAEDSVPSAEENAQLDNAAEMLDSAANELEDIDQNAIGQPADDAAVAPPAYPAT